MYKNNHFRIKNNYTLIAISLPFFEKCLPYSITTGAHSDWISIIDR